MRANSASILFSGDFAPCLRFEKLVLHSGKEIFGDLQENITRADLSFLNLEAPLCLEGKPIEKSGPIIRAHPDCIRAVAEAGFDVIGLANNHMMDFGETGLVETIKTCKSVGLITCGAGENLEQAQHVQVVERNGLKIAFVAVAEHEFSIAGTIRSGAAPLDIVDNTLQIEQARKHADLVLVTIHGGNEYFPLPRPGLRKICRFYINRGADAVICHHAHVPGAYEIFQNKPIVYSLGNLIFDHGKPPKGWDAGYAVNLEYSIRDKEFIGMDLIPYTQSVPQSGIRKMQGRKKAAFLQTIAEYNRILEDRNAYIEAWNTFCMKEKNIVLLKHYLPFHFRGMRKISKILNPAVFLMPTSMNRRVKLNTIRCESHLEVLQTVLGEEFIP